MPATAFREEELVTRKLNGQTKVFPIVGGRLRLAHEENEHLNLQTELVNWNEGQYAVFRCTARTTKGTFIGYGTANAQRDARLAESLIELAETRSIARALRFAGYGVEYTGAEEVSHVPSGEATTERPNPRSVEQPYLREVKREESVPQDHGDDEEKASLPQVKFLYALTRKAKWTQDDVANAIQPYAKFEELPKHIASELISSLKNAV